MKKRVRDLSPDLYDKAIKNIKNQGGWFDGCDNQTLGDAFNWERSNEGTDYWREVQTNKPIDIQIGTSPQFFDNRQKHNIEDILPDSVFVQPNIQKFRNSSEMEYVSRHLVTDLGENFEYRYITVKESDIDSPNASFEAYKFKENIVELTVQEAQDFLNSNTSGIEYKIKL